MQMMMQKQKRARISWLKRGLLRVPGDNWRDCGCHGHDKQAELMAQSKAARNSVVHIIKFSGDAIVNAGTIYFLEYHQRLPVRCLSLKESHRTGCTICRIVYAAKSLLAHLFLLSVAAPKLLGGGGVYRAIHDAAGPELLEACRKLPVVQGRSIRCPTGQAHITPY